MSAAKAAPTTMAWRSRDVVGAGLPGGPVVGAGLPGGPVVGAGLPALDGTAQSG